MARQSLFVFLLLILVVPSGAIAQNPEQEEAVTVAYYYKVKWGFQDEFLNLYNKNHYPVLEAQLKTGRLLDIQTYIPRFHGDGKADWTFLTVLVFKNWETLNDPAHEEEIKERLYPDQGTFQREEARRFEILEAHWDVPLKRLPMGQ